MALPIDQMDRTTDVAVIMPHRDCERYLRQAVDSILTQRDVSLALYFVDDSSPTNAWLDIIAQFRGDRRLIVKRTNRTVGPFRITNWVLDHTTEPFIAFQDSDDHS